MADTLRFKSLAITTHITCIFITLLSVSLLIYLLIEMKLFLLEINIPNLHVKMLFSLLLTAILNLSTAFLAGCSISSKNKVYMKFFTIYSSLNILIVFLLTGYNAFLAKLNFGSIVTRDRINNCAIFSDIESYYQNAIIKFKERKLENLQDNDILNDNNCVMQFIYEKYGNCVNFYLLTSVMLIILNILLHLLINVASDMYYFEYKVQPEIEEEEIVVRNVVEMGYASGSLRKGRIDFEKLRKGDYNMAYNIDKPSNKDTQHSLINTAENEYLNGYTDNSVSNYTQNERNNIILEKNKGSGILKDGDTIFDAESYKKTQDNTVNNTEDNITENDEVLNDTRDETTKQEEKSDSSTEDFI